LNGHDGADRERDGDQGEPPDEPNDARRARH
jgi:hypothetical protein